LQGSRPWAVFVVTQHTDRFLLMTPIVKGGSVAEWIACWTREQQGPGSNHSRDAVG